MPKDLVIGAGGFIGASVMRCLKDGTVGVTRSNYNQIKEQEQEYNNLWWCAGLSSKIYCEDNPDYCWEQNVDNVCAAIGDFNYNKFIYISSLDVYPENWNWQEKTEDKYIDPETIAAYGKTKLQGEEVVRTYADKWLCLRCNGFTGPGLKKNVIYDLNQIEKQTYVGIKSQFQFIHVDVFVYFAGWLSKIIGNEIVNVSSPNPISVEEVANYLQIPLEEINHPPHKNRVALFNTEKMQNICTEYGWGHKTCFNKYVPIEHWNKEYLF